MNRIGCISAHQSVLCTTPTAVGVGT